MLGTQKETLLTDRAAAKYTQVRSRLGDDVLKRVERQITLHHIDHGWAEYLARVADIRENIHLVVLANQDPLDEFHKAVGRGFVRMRPQPTHSTT